ncbi:DUF305 domain-containing protein [Streptomyces sp. NBC_00335]|uniref:DUF305 domain-containing protein n=1 Tax=unclassified Streptomyces TaxID=2593676 RepID=UPI00224DFAC2|nr:MULTISPECIES: DUF305 domain-containing protein [unclassified Streptomyces]MCX5404039.1 DUF305 domain-containing protein [Streptomyces sp. NBC_00086]
MTRKRSLIRRVTAVTAAATAALVLAACGGNGNGNDSGSAHNGHNTASPSASAPAQQGDHNAADTAFAQGMIPHHRQAIEMADLATTRAESAEVKKLADEIKKAQDPEIETLSGWLTSWGEKVPAEDAGHGGHDMSGMMTAEEMKQLEASSDKAFDTAFLTMMVKHHEGAVAMAKTEQADGTYQPAKDMAQAIITSQSAEIARMNTLLGKS